MQHLAGMNSASSDEITFHVDYDDRVVRMHSNRYVQPSILRAMHDGDDRLFDVSLYGSPPAGVAAADLRPIRAHKNVLAYASKHLYDLFTSDGYIDSHQREYHIEAVDHESLRHIVTFIYTDEIKVDFENADDVFCGVLVGADYLVIKNIVNACEKLLAGDQHVTPYNCVKLWCLARKLSCFTLMDATSTFMARNLEDVPKYADFLSMPYDDFAKLIMSEALVTTDADLRCLAAIAWLAYDRVGRAPMLSDVVNMIPLTSGSISSSTIYKAHECEMVREHAPETLLKLSAESAAVVSCGASWQKNCWYVMGGKGRYDATLRQFCKYDVTGRSWSSLPRLPWKRERFSACAVGKQLIAMGGYKDDKDTSRHIDEYDLLTKTWSKSTGKLTSRFADVLALSDGQQAYALSDIPYPGCIDVYNCTSQKVTQTADAWKERGAATIKVCSNSNENCIYFAGRVANNIDNRHIGKYEIANNKWAKVGKMLGKRRNCLEVTLAGDALYLIGGLIDQESVDTVEVFNIRTGHSRTVPHLLQARWTFCATTICNEYVVCVLGGRTAVYCGELSSVEVYDTREGKWSTGTIIPNMPTPSSHFGFAAV